MSITFRPDKEILFEELFDGRLEEFGVKETILAGQTTSNYRCLTNEGGHSMWIFGDEVIKGLTMSATNGFPLTTLFLIETIFGATFYLEDWPTSCQSKELEDMENWMIQYWNHDCGRGRNGKLNPGYSIKFG